MAVTVTVAGTTYDFLAFSLSIDTAVEERSTCDLVIPDDATNLTFAQGDEVTVDDGADRIFGGYVDSAELESPPPHSWRRWRLSCIDRHYLADRRIAAKAYEDTSAGAIVTDLHTRYLSDEGVTLGTVEDGPTVGQATFNYVSVSEALDELAERAGFTWEIDATKTLDFRTRESKAAPWTLTGSDALKDVRKSVGNPKYRNRQWVRGGRAKTDTQTETKSGDGERRDFAMGFPLAEKPTVQVNGTSQTVGIKGVDDGKQWYWNKGDENVTQDRDETKLTSSDTLQVDYVGLYNIVAVVENDDEVTAEKGQSGGTGQVENVMEVPQSTDRGDSFDLAEAKLAKFATVGEQVRARTTRSGLKAGHLLTVDLPDLDLNSVEMLVTKVGISDHTGNSLIYDVECVTGPNNGSWSLFFRDLSRRIGEFVDFVRVGSGEVVSILNRVPETLEASESVTQDVFACTQLPADLPYEVC